ncbi:Gfo/Idh/MocA family protein [Parvularcula marina]|uniref:Gfo/Idh/MocA family protein n=1 Tax=Parvularcula marina TaxID=2292771 RepID=UPI0035192FD5
MSTNLRAGVAGAGVFGGYHANKYAEAAGADLAAIYDVDLTRAQEGASKHGAVGTDDFDEFLRLIDVVTIATPASTHGALAEKALTAGKHVLVEKPISLDLDVADRLIALSQEKGCVLQVGHQERYVADAFGLFDRGAPVEIRSRRLNKFSGRAMDVSVVFDLMIHDLDLLALLADTDTAEITHLDVRAEHGDLADYVDVALLTSSGIRAQLTASRLEENPNRDLGLVFGEGEIVLDFLKRETTNTTSTPLPVDFGSDDKPRALADPLAHGTETFLEAVRTGSEPTVGGRAGRRALSLALMIENAAMAALKDQ